MESARVVMSSKGQVVIPKPVRERLHFREGAALLLVEQDGGVFLKPAITKNKSIADWKPINPAGVHLTTEELCRPVDLNIKPPRRKGRA